MLKRVLTMILRRLLRKPLRLFTEEGRLLRKSKIPVMMMTRKVERRMTVR